MLKRSGNYILNSLLGVVKNTGSLLLLCFPNTDKPILKMLEARTTDREAQEFVRKLKDIQKAIGDEE